MFLLVLTTAAKTLFVVLDKPQLVGIFSKIYFVIFALYWFGFLGFFCYTITRDGNYLSLIFTIPFWLAGIYMVYRIFFKGRISLQKEEDGVFKPSRFNLKVIVGVFLVGICLAAGILMLFFGIRDTYRLNKTLEGYSSVDGSFSGYDVYHMDEDGTTYRLIYTYNVDDVEYTVATDYGAGSIPGRDSVREVKYNPNNPNEAVLTGTNAKNFLIYMGAFFTMGAIAFILAACHMMGWFDKVKINVMGMYFGVVFTIIGIGILMFQNGTTGSLKETVHTMRFWIMIPILFIAVGILQIIKCIVQKHR